MPANLEAFQNLLNQSNPNSLIAGIQKLPYQPPGQGPNRQLKQWDSGPGRSGTYKGLNNYQFIDDDMPNPFGGGGAPYVPGASLPGMQGMDVAAIPHPGAYPYGQPNKFDAWEKQYQQHQLEQQKIKSWLNNEPPNPFGGGSGPYLPGAMVPGYPGAAGNIGGLA